ncbi:nuclease S1 [Calycina marina]|uniref:Nuclease S1 n=1 Tax=Calycina marina TaxID=1763456 RepID=A0A9P8CGT4_9HELO|nr:nuclease S1 [Calycina marina]
MHSWAIPSHTTVAYIAFWADSHRYTAAGRFSEPLHFISANDNPPSACGVNFGRECGIGGCIVGAIENHECYLRFWTRNIAAKIPTSSFHINTQSLGDIHQPLHVEDLLAGGNGICVSFSGVLNNLQHFWDTSIPEKLVGNYSLPGSQGWLLGSRGLSLGDPAGRASVWAGKANAWVCEVVVKGGVEELKERDLNGGYYEKIVPVVQLLAT